MNYATSQGIAEKLWRTSPSPEARRQRSDGLVLDVAVGHIYWTNMGDPKRNDGSIMRSDLNGKNMITIVPPGQERWSCFGIGREKPVGRRTG
jgi:hypothetical protein